MTTREQRADATRDQRSGFYGDVLARALIPVARWARIEAAPDGLALHPKPDTIERWRRHRTWQPDGYPLTRWTVELAFTRILADGSEVVLPAQVRRTLARAEADFDIDLIAPALADLVVQVGAFRAVVFHV